MDVADAYSKLREQIIMCHPSSRKANVTDPAATQSSLRGGLNLVNSTNLEYFNDTQKAELFRLKGTFLQSLDRQPEANQAYSNAAQIGGDYGKNWYTWGEYRVPKFHSSNLESQRHYLNCATIK